MESSRRMTFPIPRLLLLSFLISTTLPPSSTQAQNLKCFICSSETSSKCEGGLSSSDTTLIKECSRGMSNRVKPSGCQVFILQTGYYEYPRERIVMRDCLYPVDIEQHYSLPWDHFPYQDDPWYSGEKFTDHSMWNKGYRSVLTKVNEYRQKSGLPLLPMKRYFWRSKEILRFYIHSKSEHWNVSNGEAASTLFPDFYKKPTQIMRSVKCFVCTHDDPGCEGQLTPSSTALIKDCVGSEETTVPIGCQIIAAVFDYPHPTYFYRDCLYENYLRCHKRLPSHQPDSGLIDFSERMDCLNEIRRYLGLETHRKSTEWKTKPTTILYFIHGQESPELLYDHIEHHLNQPNMSNGIRIADIVNETKPKPDDFKIPGPFSCHTCDTQTKKCGGDKGEVIGNLPQQECKPANDDAFGCMLLYSVNHSPTVPHIHYSTRWMRRGCWYKGDLFCLKRVNLPSGRYVSGGVCPPPKKKKCDARWLITEGNTVYWNGHLERTRSDWNHELHEEFRNCLRNVRQRLGVTESLPELPKFEDAEPLDGKGTGLVYSFCAGRTLCNDKETYNVELQKPTPPTTTTTTTTTTTSTSTTTTSTTTTPPPTRPPTVTGGGGTCDPDEEVDDPDCVCEGNCSKSKKDSSWIQWILWILLGITVITSLIVVGVVLFLKTGERVAPEYPEPPDAYPASYPTMQEGQWNSNGPVGNSPPGQEGLPQRNNSSSSSSY